MGFGKLWYVQFEALMGKNIETFRMLGMTLDDVTYDRLLDAPAQADDTDAHHGR